MVIIIDMYDLEKRGYDIASTRGLAALTLVDCVPMVYERDWRDIAERAELVVVIDPLAETMRVVKSRKQVGFDTKSLYPLAELHNVVMLECYRNPVANMAAQIAALTVGQDEVDE